MRFLLDTHIALWWITYNSRLSARAQRLIEDDENDVYLSVASIWEIGIKNARPNGLPDDILMSGEEALAEFQQAGLEILPIRPRHAAIAGDLPPHHGDPFDRMLVAQALSESLTLMTHDGALAKYNVSLWYD